MANEQSQKLLVLAVDPYKTQDLTAVLEKFEWWGEGWSIEQVATASHGENSSQVFVTVVLKRQVTHKARALGS